MFKWLKECLDNSAQVDKLFNECKELRESLEYEKSLHRGCEIWRNELIRENKQLKQDISRLEADNRGLREDVKYYRARNY